MRPSDYLNYLTDTAEKEGLPASDLRPCSSVDISSVEHEAGMHLPSQYIDFLCEVGTGKEYGGLSCWLHLDVTRPKNVIEFSRATREDQLEALKETGGSANGYPKGLLIVYDSNDGQLYGFRANSGSTYLDGVFCWDTDDLSLEKVADSFYEFLDYLAEPEDEE